jgi:YggT family protein
VILLGNTLAALARVLHIVLMISLWLVILRAVLSWVYIPSLHQVARIIYRLTEPVLRPVRRLVPPSKVSGLDLSPLIVGLVIVFLDRFLVDSLILYAHRLLRGVEVSF